MKLPILTAALFLLLGTTASIHARQEKGQDEHPQESKPAQQQAKPAQQRTQAKPAEHQQTQGAKPAQHQAKAAQQPQPKTAAHSQTTTVKPAPQQHTQQAAHPQPQQVNPANRAPQGNTEKSQARAPQSQPAGGNRGASEHGRISDAHYAASFGSGHSFRVNQGDYDHRRFQYGGYSFGFVDPWPIGWGYSDDVYVVYTDGGYYMYDRVHPGLRISINIL